MAGGRGRGDAVDAERTPVAVPPIRATSTRARLASKLLVSPSELAASASLRRLTRRFARDEIPPSSGAHQAERLEPPSGLDASGVDIRDGELVMFAAGAAECDQQLRRRRPARRSGAARCRSRGPRVAVVVASGSIRSSLSRARTAASATPAAESAAELRTHTARATASSSSSISGGNAAPIR